MLASQSRGPGDRADAPVPELEQVLGRRASARRVRRRDDRDPLVERDAGIDDDEREALVLQRLQLRARLLREHQHGAVRGAADEPVEQRHLAVVLVEGRTEDDAHVLLVECLRRAGEDRAEVRRLDQRDGHADQARAAARERARVPVRAEPLLADGAQHRLPRLRRDVRPAVEDARDRGDRDARRACDSADGGALAVVVGVGGHRVGLKQITGNGYGNIATLVPALGTTVNVRLLTSKHLTCPRRSVNRSRNKEKSARADCGAERSRTASSFLTPVRRLPATERERKGT